VSVQIRELVPATPPPLVSTSVVGSIVTLVTIVASASLVPITPLVVSLGPVATVTAEFGCDLFYLTLSA